MRGVRAALLLHEEPGQRMVDAQQRQIVVVLRPLAVGSEADMTAIDARLVKRWGFARHRAFVRLHTFLHEAKEPLHSLAAVVEPRAIGKLWYAFFEDPKDGKWYIAYHRWEGQAGNGPYSGSRRVAIQPITYRDDGVIETIKMK